jgi:hypothetical protein
MTPSEAKTDRGALGVFYFSFCTALVVCVCGVFIPSAIEAACVGCGICCGAVGIARAWDWLIPKSTLPEEPV